jgi:hypothetical protein
MDQSSIRNLFEVNNARTQTIPEVVHTFLPLRSYWRLINGKNHVILGSRGSGKTAVLRMLAHDHLSKFEHRTAKKIIASRSFVGIYVPMRADWIGTLKNKPWNRGTEESFRWRLNLSCCAAFTETAESCLNSYTEGSARAFAERDLARMLTKSWLPNSGSLVSTLSELRALLEDVEWAKQVGSLSSLSTSTNSGSQGSTFDLDLFSPIRRGIQILKRVMQFPKDATWALALDELEFLEPEHHRLINTYLRAKSDLAFKLSTMPYFHHTLQTNTSQPIVAGNDFDYVYLDNDPAVRRTDRSSWLDWANEVLARRIAYVTQNPTYSGFSLAKVLGDSSPLIDEKPSEWGPSSPMMSLLGKFSSVQTVKRAQRLPPKRFKNEISRKMHALLLLREQASVQRGHAVHELFSGPKYFALCSDANPRQLIRLFNELTLTRASGDELNIKEHVRPANQTKYAISFSDDALRSAATEEGIGGELHAFVKTLMEYFRGRFYHQALTSDYYYSISLSDDTTDEQWRLIKYAVGLGFMFPNISFMRPDQLPDRRSGEFNMAFRLTPKFGLLPRKGRSVSLNVALYSGHISSGTQFPLALESR